MVDNTTQWTTYDPDATDYMVNIISPEQQFIFSRNSVRNMGHRMEIKYLVGLAV